MKVGLFGANGRMGRVLIEALDQNENAELSVATVRDDSPWIGMNVGELAGIGKKPIDCLGMSSLTQQHADVMIDFTLPVVFENNIAWCVANKMPVVIGTTGLSESQLAVLDEAAKTIPIVFAANYSVGVNLMLSLVRQAAKALGNTADIEITEAHHRFKQDAPSGTAMAIGEAIADELGRDLKTCAVYGREGKEPERDQGTIGFATVRAGDIVGEHTALFADIGERLEITHKASSRLTFAKGAVHAAQWLHGKPAGLYSMVDVLDLK
ncbi:4-hydroxy-tetrahydrodipicolinate reductase [Alteromonas naphthalenivorans]|jgi:4-hydroxy-tetrahydrodipicolinate reductase|uniref:4-hydroxy-tetrahydrodipicolinate reductase n=1 Tax=Alteromonas naphthalenivorans TaxID=715451 RepID=F5ZD55_ALTNA|nr:4-hydroxy-tetrahydrodipicolinate reductase [Alteromonas naphthalenivorans]AEF03817.1 dihydrodipicolinate reductase [Alteromonas naphthalenivorans]|tara:strand:+ start:5816 stop:6616 length:801 start_codon:yes stop_codon:yes gene_type:complete